MKLKKILLSILIICIFIIAPNPTMAAAVSITDPTNNKNIIYQATLGGTCSCQASTGTEISMALDTADKFNTFKNKCIIGSRGSLDCNKWTVNSISASKITIDFKSPDYSAITDLYVKLVKAAIKRTVADGGACIENEDCKNTALTCINNTCQAPTTGAAPAAPTEDDTVLPNPLNTVDPNVVIGRMIRFLVSISGSLALLMFVYGGIMWLISRGNTELINKGKTAMKMSLIGLAVIFSAYIIVKLLITALGVIA